MNMHEQRAHAADKTSLWPYLRCELKLYVVSRRAETLESCRNCRLSARPKHGERAESVLSETKESNREFSRSSRRLPGIPRVHFVSSRGGNAETQTRSLRSAPACRRSRPGEFPGLIRGKATETNRSWLYHRRVKLNAVTRGTARSRALMNCETLNRYRKYAPERNTLNSLTARNTGYKIPEEQLDAIRTIKYPVSNASTKWSINSMLSNETCVDKDRGSADDRTPARAGYTKIALSCEANSTVARGEKPFLRAPFRIYKARRVSLRLGGNRLTACGFGRSPLGRAERRCPRNGHPSRAQTAKDFVE